VLGVSLLLRLSIPLLLLLLGLLLCSCINATQLRLSTACLLTLPIASNPLSKKRTTPRKVNKKPKAVRPSPISAQQQVAVAAVGLSTSS
jgi:hypothetical protein